MQKEIPNAVDLEETQELPALPGAVAQAPSEPARASTAPDDHLAATDAYSASGLHAAADFDSERTLLWPAPRAESRVEPRLEPRMDARGDDTREQRQALNQREAEIGSLRSDLASARESRGRLESNLGNLTSNLRGLEQTLNQKSEQLSMFEREVGVRDRRIAELESRRATLDGELAAANAERETLRHDLNASREDVEAARKLAQANDRRISELESRGATLDGELAAANTERETLRTDLNAAREDTEAARKMAQANDASAGAVMKERDQQIRRVRLLEADLNQARATAERYRETLQSMEGRRQIFESMMDEQETELIERGATVVHLETEMAKRTQFITTRESELKGLLTTEQERVRQLEQAAIIHRAEEQSLRRAVADASSAADEKLGDMRREMHAQQQLIEELKGRLDKVNSSLNERNSMIERMEQEMHSSSQVLGNIQENLQHLGDAEPVRMLVRTQGETGIVQLLSKRTSIGRTPDNDIHLNEDFISRHHAVLLSSGVNMVLEDLNSTNGTYVNGERVNRRTVKEGDLVTFGKTEFRFVVKKAADKPA
jgi:chromosome segregation ATPase